MNISTKSKKGLTITPKLLVSGFTLIEIIVVITIMAVLTVVVYSSFNGAKTQSRDQQRVSDMSVIQLALEVYFNQKHQYPKNLSDLLPTYISSIPSGDYNYFPIGNTAGSPICISYHLYTTFENTNTYLSSKKGFDSTSAAVNECGTGHTTRINASSVGSLIYDATP